MTALCIIERERRAILIRKVNFLMCVKGRTFDKCTARGSL
jgi:hypothetical protein